MKTTKKLDVRYSPECEKQVEELKQIIKEKDSKFHKQLLKAIEREKDYLFINPHRGIQVEKRKIPPGYITQHGVNNLWKINLPDYWRMIYTIAGNELEIISILLEFMDHKTYNKKFKYENK